MIVLVVGCFIFIFFLSIRAGFFYLFIQKWKEPYSKVKEKNNFNGKKLLKNFTQKKKLSRSIFELGKK